ncbi:MAG: hypothetical protein ABI968_02315, partial [Acidobacteriota bacterium]
MEQWPEWSFGVVVAVAIVEMVLSLRWSEFYFSNGLRVFRREVSAHSPRPELPSPERMEDRLKKSVFPSVHFVGWTAAAWDFARSLAACSSVFITLRSCTACFD